MSDKLVDATFSVTENKIGGFFKKYRFLSNFHEYPVKWQGLVYGSSEAAFQAAKSTDQYIRLEFSTLSPSEAKGRGQKVQLREGWDSIKDSIMYDILIEKFTSCEDLKKDLLDTGDMYLEETNWWGDRYWGVCNGHGLNKLGSILMQVRAAIRKMEVEPTPPPVFSAI